MVPAATPFPNVAIEQSVFQNLPTKITSIVDTILVMGSHSLMHITSQSVSGPDTVALSAHARSNSLNLLGSIGKV
jgi:hypothetical protein